MAKENKSKGNVPNLRFPGFKGEWEEKKLGGIGEFKNGINKSNEDFGFGVPFINLMDVFGKLTIASKEGLGLVNAKSREIDIYNLKKGDVLFIRSSVKKSGVGETSVIAEDLPNTVYSGFLIRFRESKDTLSLTFKKYCFCTKKFRNDLISLSATSANTNINQDSLNSLNISFPSISEQNKIGLFLSYIDERIETQNKIIEGLKLLKEQVSKKIYSQKLRFKDDKGEDFQKWQVKKLRDVCDILGGGTPDTNKFEYWEGNIQWFTPTEIKSNFVSKSERTISELGLKNSSAKLLPKGAILLTTRATIGEVAIAQQACSTNQGFQSLIAKESSNNIFLLNWLKVNKYELEKRANGSTFPEISKSEIEKIEINIPDIYEQKKIANMLLSIDYKIDLAFQLLQKFESQKKYLLNNLFT